MNLLQKREEDAAWVARADRFDGFDRGDLDRDDAADFAANCEADEPNAGRPAMVAAAKFASDLIAARNALQSILNAGRAKDDAASLLKQIEQMRGIAAAALETA